MWTTRFCRFGCISVLVIAGASAAQAESPRKVRPDVLDRVEQELKRLNDQTSKETGPNSPPASDEVAFLLLTGLAAEGAKIEQPTAEDFRELGIVQFKGGNWRFFAVSDETRIVIASVAIQDKAGTFTSKSGTLYRQRDGKWTARGTGETAMWGNHTAD
jgi:hypothetical protein